MAKWTLRQARRYSGPCFLTFHSPSPQILRPVLSTSRCKGSVRRRTGMLTVRVACRRLTVLKQGTGQSSPSSLNTLQTKPRACRKASLNKTFSVSTV